MTRIELGLKMMWIVPATAFAVGIAVLASVGPTPAEQWIGLVQAGNRLTWFAGFMLIGVQYAFCTATGDPFWLARKRLWTRGRFAVVFFQDHLDRGEPMFWERRCVPHADDASELLE